MTSLSRRGLIRGVAGASAALAASPALARKAKEDAFPPEAAFKPAPGEALIGPNAGVVRLNSNENPYGPSEAARKMVEYAAGKGAYYPDKTYAILAEMIAERHGVDVDQIAITTGSAEALCAIGLIYGRKGPVVAPRLFWDTTALYAVRLGLAEIDRVPLTEELEVDLPAIEARVTEATGLVHLCNPNNPTGRFITGATFKPAVQRMAKKTTVLVDEAYMELADDPDGNTCIGLVRAGKNVIVARTFSKIYGMAGLRVGYTISSAETAEAIRQTAMSWIAGTGLAAAIGAYKDEKFLAMSRSRITEGRQMVMETAAALGMHALPSHTNFVYFKSGRKANDLQAALQARDILIRPQYMDYEDWSRVSMGRIEDVKSFCKALPEAVQA